MDIGDNFTPRALQVLALARKEVGQFNHSFVNSEHLLLGLIKFGQGVGVNILLRLGYCLEELREEVTKRMESRGEKEVSTILYTPRAKHILSLAEKEAAQMRHTYVGTEHLLLGMIKEGEGIAAKVLKARVSKIEVFREAIFGELDPAFGVRGSEIEPVKIELKKGPLQSALALLQITGNDLSDEAKTALLKAKIAIMKDVCNLQIPLQESAQTLLDLILDEVIPNTRSEQILMAMAEILTVLIEGGEGAAKKFASERFNATRGGTSEERSWGIVLQTMTKAPLTRTLDFLSRSPTLL